jgi:hypothetical protein
LKVFIRTEVELQERLEATGYRPPTWRLLRALQKDEGSQAIMRVYIEGRSLASQKCT